MSEACLVTMTLEQQRVLDRMWRDLGCPFADIAADCFIPIATARAIVRQFHDLGIAEFGPLFSEDEPKIMGRGYWLSAVGYWMQRDLRRIVGPRGLMTPAELEWFSREWAA